MKSFKLNIAKKEVEYFETSFKPYGLSCMSNPAFLNNVIDFGKFGKDKINEETIEFLVPYLEIEGFNPQVRRAFSFLRPFNCFCFPAFEPVPHLRATSTCRNTCSRRRKTAISAAQRVLPRCS